jgi:cation transport ATPase
MIHTYSVSGMTCSNCKASVEKALRNLEHVEDVAVDLESSQVVITMSQHISVSKLQNALSNKYTISEKPEKNIFQNATETDKEISEFKQLFPLFLIFGYITIAAFLLNFKPLDWSSFMLDFMGLFYIVFSFFKFLDLKGFPESFRMYDPLAKVLPAYGWIYPFMEVALGLMFLMRFEIFSALIITLFVLGITTVGVTQSLLGNKKIKCACLGTALNLPMTKATFIENSIMIVMAIIMLLKTYSS